MVESTQPMTDTGEQSYGEEAGGACRMDESTDQSRRIVTQDESTRKGSQLLASTMYQICCCHLHQHHMTSSQQQHGQSGA